MNRIWLIRRASLQGRGRWARMRHCVWRRPDNSPKPSLRESQPSPHFSLRNVTRHSPLRNASQQAKLPRRWAIPSLLLCDCRLLRHTMLRVALMTSIASCLDQAGGRGVDKRGGWSAECGKSARACDGGACDAHRMETRFHSDGIPSERVGLIPRSGIRARTVSGTIFLREAEGFLV